MAERDNVERYVHSNAPERTDIHLRFTGAADIQAAGAAGYVINAGSRLVTSVTRAAEGVITITLADTYATFLGLDYNISKDDTTVTTDAETVATNRTITLTCRTGGADVDPDSAVFHVTIKLMNSNAGIQ